MSDSEEFASADEEVNEKELREESVKEEEETQPPPASAIQRQPSGVTNVEESRDARQALDSLAEKKAEPSGGWGFGGWGSSLLSTAKSSVTTLTTQLGDGISTVMETVESALDVPPPEELSKEEGSKKEEEKKEEQKEEKKEEGSEAGWWSAGWGVTSSVVTSGRSLMTGGLDVLETIGKKTMEVLHETDPGLSRTRSLLRSGRAPGTSLSQALREARSRHEEEAQREARWEEERKGHFGAQFEDCQGMAHLEALEMLSSQCESRLHSQLNRLSGDELSERKQRLKAIKALFERVEEEEEEEEEEERNSEQVRDDVKTVLSRFQLPAAQEVLRVHEEKVSRLEEAGGDEEVMNSLNQAGVQLLALLSSAWVGLFHKAGELAMADGLKLDEEIAEAVKAAEVLVRCAEVASQDISCFGEEVAMLLREKSGEEDRRLSTQLVTGIYLESGNSRAYVRDAFLLLLPVLQLAALN